MRYVKVDRASEQTAHADNGQANCPNKTFSTTLIGMLVEYLNQPSNLQSVCTEKISDSQFHNLKIKQFSNSSPEFHTYRVLRQSHHVLYRPPTPFHPQLLSHPHKCTHFTIHPRYPTTLVNKNGLSTRQDRLRKKH